MFKIIVSMLLLFTSELAYPESRVFNDKKMTFRDFAKLSAIISQCEIKNLLEKDNLNKFAKLQGLKLAKENKISQNNIAKEVSLILYELDKDYPEIIPISICENTITIFKQYQMRINHEFKNKSYK